MLFTLSTVELIGPTNDHAEFFHLDLIAVAAQPGASNIGKFAVRVDGQELTAVLGIFASGSPISGGNTLVAVPCPPFCKPPATPSNPMIVV